MPIDFGSFNFFQSVEGGGVGSDPSFFTYYETGSSFDTDKGPDGAATNFLFETYGSSVSSDLGNFNSVDPINQFGVGVVEYEEGFERNSLSNYYVDSSYPIDYGQTFTTTKQEAINLVVDAINFYQEGIKAILDSTTDVDFKNAPAEFRGDDGRYYDTPSRYQLVQHYNLTEVVKTSIVDNDNALYFKENMNDFVTFGLSDIKVRYRSFLRTVEDSQLMNAVTAAENGFYGIVPGGE